MELRQLRYFVAVAEEGNISRAAQKIFLTQPALSRQIKALEEEIGHCLFERQAHSIRLTQTGQTLLGEARELLLHADQVLDRVRVANHATRLRVGYAPSLATGLLSTTVQQFTQTHPNARVELLDLSSTEMLAGLENGRIDVALSVGPQRPTRGLKWTSLLRAPWHLAVHHHHDLARKSNVTAADVAHQPLLMFAQRDYPEYWDLVLGWLRKHRQRPRIAGEYDGVDSLLAAVEAGLGVALVTTRSPHRTPAEVRLKKLATPPEPLCIGAGHKSERSQEKPLAAFLDHLRQAAQNFR